MGTSRFPWRPGLLARLAVALALVGLLPVAFTTRRLVGLNDGAMTEQVESLHSVSARTTAERIGKFLESRLALAVGMAADPTLADPRSEAARSLLSRNLGAWEGLGVEGLVVANTAGEEVIRAQLADEAAKRRVAAAAAVAPGPDVLMLPGEERPLVRVEASLPEGSGLLWLVCDGQEIPDALVNYELGENADLLLVDRERRALVGAQELVDDFPPDILDYALTNWLSGVKPDFRSADGQQFIGAWAPVPQARWAVLSRQPTEVAHRVAARMRRQSNLAVGGAALLIGLLAAGAYVSVVRPIRQLTRAQRRLAGLPSGAGRGDEISQLKAAFAALEERLAERERLDEVFLGRYQVTEVIGSGAMGTVFRGWDPKLKRPVALKTVRLDRKLPEKQRHELVDRLLNEAVTVARFNHPNIVAVFDIEDHPEGAYVAMELVDGTSLELLVWENKRLAAAQVVPLGAAIARALESAHRRGIVHRDVKPANVLLGSDGSIKVTDFGISELLSSMAPTGDVVFGTPGFVPPETLRGEGYDESGDLFSMGAVLYTCLVGRSPFDGKTVKEVVRRTLFGVLEAPGRKVADVPPELDDLVLNLLSRDPARRPADAGRVAEILEELARRHGLEWAPPDRATAHRPPPEALQASQFIPTIRLREKSGEDQL